MFSGRSQISYFRFIQFICLVSLERFSLSDFYRIYHLCYEISSHLSLSRSNKLSLYRRVSNYNGLFIFNDRMPTPCNAKDLKEN